MQFNLQDNINCVIKFTSENVPSHVGFTSHYASKGVLLLQLSSIAESWNTGLEGTKKIILSNLCWQKHGLDSMAQHPAQLNLKSAQC